MLVINRYLVIVGAGLFILIVSSLVLALTTEVSTLEEGTPRVWPTFLEHLKNDRFSEAHSFLTLDKQKTCDAVHFLRQFSDYGIHNFRTRIFRGTSLIRKLLRQQLSI